MGLVGFITFAVWGTAEIQPWNRGSLKYQQKKNREDNISSQDLMNFSDKISKA